ncbi:hypothetical protein Vretimale_3092 [Volvox reticuliferus]|uniref:CASTOR/POLLUX/SYM8 ion channel conserved domain-containing protein n=1 Tax=Volvox reticuliferus TaxID=1737510 RepID=A0A8J4FLL8_9CHLO|nr:hypothetical protein Vretifemale_6724 [Volvox reticuliferus]GIL97443.1 hypothetical protein Vretimale_3092 [Volvox reticuliferus]
MPGSLLLNGGGAGPVLLIHDRPTLRSLTAPRHHTPPQIHRIPYRKDNHIRCSSKPLSQSPRSQPQPRPRSSTPTTAAAGGGDFTYRPGGTQAEFRSARSPTSPAVVRASTSGGDSSSAASGWNPAIHGIVSVRQRSSPFSSGSSFSPSSPHFAACWSCWLLWIARIGQTLQGWVKYQLMRLFRLPTWGKLLMLVLVGLPIVMVGASLLTWVTNMAWGEAAQMVFYVLQSVPGADVTKFADAGAQLVLVATHLVSLYTFATLVGLLTEDVRSNVEDIRCGNFPVSSRNHTVLLDGSSDPSRVLGTLQKVLEAEGGAAYSGDVAVLSPHPKDELDQMIADMLPEHSIRVVTRHGNPVRVADLERVAAVRARTVLLLAPDRPMGCIGPALQQQLCLTSLRTLHIQQDSSHHFNHDPHHHEPHTRNMPRPSSSSSGSVAEGDGGSRSVARKYQQKRQRVVVESGSATLSSRVAESDFDDPLQVTYVSSTSSMSRVAVQCAVQPGLAAVYDAVLCRADDASLHVVDLPAGMQGCTFMQVRRRFRRAVVCGILPGVGSSRGRSDKGEGNGGCIIFSPPDARVLRSSDRLVLLAATKEDFVPVPWEVQAPELPQLLMRQGDRSSRPDRLVLLALDSCLAPSMLDALDEFGAEGCSVTVVSPEPCSGIPPGSTPNNQLVLRNHVGDPLSPGALLAAEVIAADAVILTGTDGLPSDEADAVAVGTALLLQRLVADPWVMSHVSMEEVAAASFDTEEYWGSASFASRSMNSLNSIDFNNLPILITAEPTAAAVAADQAEAVAEEVTAALADDGKKIFPRRRPQLPSRPLTFVCSLRDPQNRSVLQHIGVEACRTNMCSADLAELLNSDGTVTASRGLSIEVVEPQALVSGMLAKVGAEPLLVSALGDMLDDEGYEIYLKRCEGYGIPPCSHVSWAQVSEVVRARQDVALGYIHRGQLHLAPPSDMTLRLEEGDKLVVMSEDC